MDSTLQRGRTFLAAALLFIAGFILKSLIESWDETDDHIARTIFGDGLMFLVLFLAFRGGHLALKLAKGCALLIAGIVGILMLVVSITLLRGQPLPTAPTVENSLPVLAMVLGVAFCVWALFFSRDVRAYVSYKRETDHQRKVSKILGRPEGSSPH